VVVAVARHRFGLGGALLFTMGLGSACGGTDNGRPERAATSPIETDAGADPCAAGAGLTFQSITTFDPPDGATRTGTRTLCDPSVNPDKSIGCTYYNFDSANSPRLCDGPLATNAPTCRQPDLTPTPDSVCMTSNFPAATPTVPVSPIPGGRCGVSNNAFHLIGTNIATCYDPNSEKQGWGITFQLTFNPLQANSGMSGKPIDASSWDGISLWVRRGSAASGSSVLVGVVDSISDGSMCNNLDPLVSSVADANKCDPYAAGVLLATNWRLVKLPFASLAQKGFGNPSPLGHLDTVALSGLKFTFSAGDWDAWIDDIAFYREQ
jgi:hypothetical protein